MSTNAGSETPRNYRFQYLYATLLAIQMYNRKNDFVELICEGDDDITAKDKNGGLTSYQVTRSDYVRTIPNEKIVKTIQHFLDLCKNDNYKKFYLVSSQRIGDITLKVGPSKYLDIRLIKKYSKQLVFDSAYVDNHHCFDKIGFRIVPDEFGLQMLIHKEIIYALGDTHYTKLNDITEELVRLAERRSRASYREESLYYTSNNEQSIEQLRKVNSTITISDISNICSSYDNIPDPNEGREQIGKQKIKKVDNTILDQSIEEANDEDEKIASTALIFLEHLAINMKIYKSKSLLSFLQKSIHDEGKIRHLSYYLDLIRRMLDTSTKLGDYSFQKYVKTHLAKRITEIIYSFDSRFIDTKLFAFQIFDEFPIISQGERNSLYLDALTACVQNCADDQYQGNLQYLVTRISHNISNVSNIRRQLVSMKKSATSDRTKERCNELLQYYK
jgi:hypothetical protein